MRRDLVLVAVLGATLFLPGLGNHDLWNPDEPRYAEVAREMAQRGDYLVPHVNGQVYAHKPPLLFWLINLFAVLTGGVDEWSTRLPSALSAVGAMMLVFLIGVRMCDRRIALFATAVFATSTRILWQGRAGQIDMLLVCLVALAMYCWVRGYHGDGDGWFRLFFLATGVATLAKGPVGLLPPLLSVLVFLAVSGDWKVARRMRIGTGLLLWAMVVLAWLVPAGIAGGREYLEEIVFRQNVGRYANPWHHFRPWYYYFTVMPANFFPWSFLLPTALVVGWRRDRGERRRAYLFSLCWMAVTVVFFTLSPGKRTVYVLTMYPAMALLVASSLAGLARRWPLDRRWLIWPVSLLTGFLLAVNVGVPLRVARMTALAPLGEALVWGLAAILAVLTAAAVAAWLAALRGRPFDAGVRLAGGMALAGLALMLWLLPQLDLFKSARGLSQQLLRHASQDEPYAIYPRLDAPYVFYTGRFAEVLDGEAALRAFASRPGRVWLIIEQRELDRLDPPLPMIEVARDRDLTSEHVLMVSRGTGAGSGPAERAPGEQRADEPAADPGGAEKSATSLAHPLLDAGPRVAKRDGAVEHRRSGG